MGESHEFLCFSLLLGKTQANRCQVSLPQSWYCPTRAVFKHFKEIMLPIFFFSQRAKTVWNDSVKSKLFFLTVNVFHCHNLQIWSLFLLLLWPFQRVENLIWNQHEKEKCQTLNTSPQKVVHSVSLWWWQYGSYERVINFLLIMIYSCVLPHQFIMVAASYDKLEL